MEQANATWKPNQERKRDTTIGAIAMRLIWSILVLLLIVLVSASDEASLLAFKAQLSHGSLLASWNSTTRFCSWEGVTCSHRRPGRVVALELNSTGLAGPLNPVIGNLTFLRKLDLRFNSLHGDIPESIGRLRCLQRLYLYDNSFSGTLPVNLSSCVSMTVMRLDNNTLGGPIPAELGEKLTSLAQVTLRNNGFTGLIPASLANLSHLQSLDLSNNQLVGWIPSGLGSIQSMRYFNLGDNLLNGMLPPSLYNWSSLELFAVDRNMLYGSIPDDIGSKFPKLKGLGLSDNHFTGTTPSSISNISSLLALQLQHNGLSGYVPPTLGRLGALQSLNMAKNKLEANDNKGWEFITSLSNCTQLWVLDIGINSFGGQLPGSVVNLSTTLQQLFFNDNRISGSIPSSLGNLSQLILLYAHHGNLEGPIPASLGELKNLWALDLSRNYHLNGSMPTEILQLPGLSQSLDMSYNSLSGPLPNDVGSLTNLNQLILSGNQFSGKIPDSLHNTNKFSGNIPEALGNIGNLQELYLEVAGNINLCGGTPQLHLSPCSKSPINKNKRKMSKSLIISLATAGAILFSLSVILLIWMLCKKLRPSQKKLLTQNSIVDEHFKRIPYHALLKGTNEFSEANLLGKGSYGAVYKCVLDTEERTLAVKVFNLGQSRYSKSFEAECEAMRRIRHRCLMKIITSCSSINHKGQEFKALVFEFMPNGNLDGWLHPESEEPTTSNTLSLSQRLDIAV